MPETFPIPERDLTAGARPDLRMLVGRPTSTPRVRRANARVTN